jgi:hypothetical protein
LIFILISRSSIGIDPVLAQHVAHLFIRDTVILFEEKLHLDDTKDADHFEVKNFLLIYFFYKFTFFRISIQQIGNQ